LSKSSNALAVINKIIMTVRYQIENHVNQSVDQFCPTLLKQQAAEKIISCSYRLLQ